MLSFIVPAHNEQLAIGRTLLAIHDSARVVGQPYEIIVVDDASTDATAEVSRQHNAAVIPVNHRQISATRNSGAQAARGERLFFVDADTTINPGAVASALQWMDKKGVAGGGALTRFDGPVPLYGWVVFELICIAGKLAGFTGGAFMFCTREAFQAAGGFDERLFAAEDVAMSFALKREGRFIVLRQRVVTSGRRLRTTSGLQMLATFFRMACLPFGTLRRRSAAVERIWYDSNRAGDAKASDAWGVKVSNFITLIVLVLLLEPLLMTLVMNVWPQTRAGPLGTIRWVVGWFTLHVGLMVYLPCAVFLLRAGLEQKRWGERIKMAMLFAFCSWQAWVSALGVIQVWTRFLQWLAHP